MWRWLGFWNGNIRISTSSRINIFLYVFFDSDIFHPPKMAGSPILLLFDERTHLTLIFISERLKNSKTALCHRKERNKRERKNGDQLMTVTATSQLILIDIIVFNWLCVRISMPYIQLNRIYQNRTKFGRDCSWFSSEMSVDETSTVDWRNWCRLCAKCTTEETVATEEALEFLLLIVEKHLLATVNWNVFVWFYSCVIIADFHLSFIAHFPYSWAKLTTFHYIYAPVVRIFCCYWIRSVNDASRPIAFLTIF